MIKAVIFDCFGVLCVDGWLAFKEEHFSRPELWQQATKLAAQTNRGELDYDDFVAAVAALAGVEAKETRRLIGPQAPNTRLFDYIATLKPRYKIGMLSNASQNWLNILFTQDEVALFDAVVLSFEIGHIKPQPEAYQAIADKLAVRPQECVFSDDQLRYCDGAEAVGMQAVHYQDFEHLRSQLGALLVEEK